MVNGCGVAATTYLRGLRLEIQVLWCCGLVLLPASIGSCRCEGVKNGTGLPLYMRVATQRITQSTSKMCEIRDARTTNNDAGSEPNPVAK